LPFNISTPIFCKFNIEYYSVAAALTVLDIDNAGVDFINKGKSNEPDAEIEQYLDKKALNLKTTLDAS